MSGKSEHKWHSCGQGRWPATYIEPWEGQKFQGSRRSSVPVVRHSCRQQFSPLLLLTTGGRRLTTSFISGAGEHRQARIFPEAAVGQSKLTHNKDRAPIGFDPPGVNAVLAEAWLNCRFSLETPHAFRIQLRSFWSMLSGKIWE